MARLSDMEPRGVVRVARAVAECWAGSDRVELIALSEPCYHRHDIVFSTAPLGQWLGQTPIVSDRGPPSAGDGCREFHSIRELDAILSFECYESIWDWPTEFYPCRMVGVFHDAIPFRIDEKDDPSRYFRAVGRMVSRSDLIFCDSESSRRDLSSFYPGSERKSRVLYLGHDRARFLPVDGEASRQAPSGGTRPTVAMVGQLEPRMNQSGMLRACRFLESHAGSDRIRLLLIGGRPTSSPYGFLEDQARQHVDVMYTGYLPDQDLASLLRQCDVFVFPSLWEGFGLPILEAMSAGVMVVTSELSSMPEVGGEHAFYCDPHDPRSIAAAVSHALSLAPSERARRIDQARDWAGSFTWERMTDALEDQILELLVDGRRDVEPAGRTPRDAPRATALAGSHEQAAPLGGMPGQLQH